jgi:dTDP-4-dehydrorhamnose reductase
MRTLVLGAAGMLGHKIHQVLSRDHEVVSTTRGSFVEKPYAKSGIFRQGAVLEGVDVTDDVELQEVVSEVRPKVVVNCVGIVKQRYEAHDPIPSITVNALLPHRLARLSRIVGARLVHFSTDCVFSGERGDYTEADASDARDLYGRTKYLGEVGPPSLTIRTSFIGREIEHFDSLVEWFLRQQGSVQGYQRAIYTGVTTLQMAHILRRVITDHPNLAGVYQVASDKISKYELLRLVRAALAVQTVVVANDDFVCDRSLVGSAFTSATEIRIPPWPKMIEDFAKDGSVYQGWGGMR